MSRKTDRSPRYRIMSYEESILNERNWLREDFRPRNKSRVSSIGRTHGTGGMNGYLCQMEA